MSKDSTHHHLHFHTSRLADIFEDFTRPHHSLFPPNTNNAGNAMAGANGVPGPSTFLPIEDIYVAPQHQPVNPEDEDDVVPDQHAAFGIVQAMRRRRDIAWRDLGLGELMTRMPGVDGGVGTGGTALGLVAKKRGIAAGGRRIVCLR